MDSVPQQSNDCVEIGGTEVWPAVVENFMLDTMLEEMKKGHLMSSTFSKTGWQRIKNALEDKFNKIYTDRQLGNKYGVMKTRYSNFKKLLSFTGMGYNEVTGQVTADDEVWALAKRMPCQTSMRQGHDWVRKLLHDHPVRIYEQLLMERHIFQHLCEEFTNHGLRLSMNITVQEQVAMFLKLLAHSNSARDNA
ncbi:hypothetical protein LINPERPRIM_LOCUS670 [Linum perenne]